MNDQQNEQPGMEQATLGGGCFWCLEAVFEVMQGVTKVVSGYAGGQTADPNYEDVCSGRTGHAEVVQLTYDPAVVTFDDLLDVFFAIHDPTTLNRQGNDVGTQYRSVIFTHSDAQAERAAARIAHMTEQHVFSGQIVTQIEPLTRFYPAETYHQGYFRGHAQQPYCQFVVAPKLAKFREKFASQAR